MLFHRLVVPQSYTCEFTWVDEDYHYASDDFYIIRVKQMNGQMAWSSPVWVNPRA